MRALAIVVCAIIVIAGYTWWQGRSRPVLEVPDAAVSTSSAFADVVTVHVIGRVRRPGVVTLPFGARVADAVEAVGGLRDGAMSGDLNLARVLVDGEQVIVGRHRSTASGEPAGSAATSDGLLDLNAATAAQLEELPGVGPVLAGRIVAWREANGPFPSVEILGEVSGIGDTLLAQLRPLVRV